MESAAHRPNCGWVMRSAPPIRGKIGRANELSAKTVPSETAISSWPALLMGAIAAMALPSRMLLAVFAEKARQHILSDGGGSSQGKLSGVIAAQCGNLLLRLNQERIRLPRVAQQNLAGRGQCDLRAGAIEELDADLFLQRLDLQADRVLGQIQLLGGLAKAALLGYGSENDQAKIFETRHKTIGTPNGFLPDAYSPGPAISNNGAGHAQ